MKKLICLMMMLCGFLTIYAQEEYSESDAVKEGLMAKNTNHKKE